MARRFVITPEEWAKVLDFGLVKRLAGGDASRMEIAGVPAVLKSRPA